MDVYQLLQALHVLLATVWVGGHIILLMAYGAELKRGTTNSLLDFERRYEKIGLPSLIFAAATGVAMLYVGWGKWPMAAHIKMGLFVILILMALHAQLRLIPRLKRGEDVGGLLLLHMAAVTAISIAFVVLGAAIRFGMPL
ncbi:MAG: CopD family protein [Pyrobaculum sp.]|jgi:putative copper export protein